MTPVRPQSLPVVPSAPTKDTSEPLPLTNTDLRGPTLVYPDPGPPASGHPPIAPSLPSPLSADGAFIPPDPALCSLRGSISTFLLLPSLSHPPLFWGAKLSIFCRENSIFVGDTGAQAGSLSLCINCTDRGRLLCVCVCLRLLLLWPGPALAMPQGLCLSAYLFQHFPLEMTGLCSAELGLLCHHPSVICWQLPRISFVPKPCPGCP